MIMLKKISLACGGIGIKVGSMVVMIIGLSYSDKNVKRFRGAIVLIEGNDTIEEITGFLHNVKAFVMGD